MEKDSNQWPGVQRRLQALKKSELIALVHDLYELSADMRNFLNARLSGRQRKDAALKPYRAIIVARFFPGGEPGDLDFALARKAIADYEKAAGDVEGVLDLKLTCVEMAARLASEIGIHDVEYYSDLGDIATGFVNLLRKHAHLYPRYAGRIKRLKQQLEGANLELDDGMAELLYGLEIDLGNIGNAP